MYLSVKALCSILSIKKGEKDHKLVWCLVIGEVNFLFYTSTYKLIQMLPLKPKDEVFQIFLVKPPGLYKLGFIKGAVLVQK